MANTFFLVSSYYGGRRLQNLIERLREQIAVYDNYTILVAEQRGARRTTRSFASIYNGLVQFALTDPACKYIWLLGDDVLPHAMCLYNTQQFLEEKDPNGEIGAVVPIEAWHETITQPTAGHGAVTMMSWTGEKLPIEEALQRPEEFIDTLFCGFACVCIRRKAWEAVGPMEEFGLGYGEDLDHGIRMWQRGFRCGTYRREWFLHERGGTFNRLREEGITTPEMPYEAAAKVKEKYPWLWTNESQETIMGRLWGWFKHVRGAEHSITYVDQNDGQIKKKFI